MNDQTPTTVMQGIAVPASSVNPELFFKHTRRQRFANGTLTFSLGGSDGVDLRQVGVVVGIDMKVRITLTTLKGTGAIATTARWPYDLFKSIRFTANGQSNLINVSGWKLKARDIMARGDLSDRGVAQGIGGASPGTARTQGTLSLANESWGVGQNVTAIADGTYTVELDVHLPIAFDEVNLLGAIFAQTSSTDLRVDVDFASQTDLFVLSGTAAVTMTGSIDVEAVVCSIPQGPNGDIIVPDLSAFHSLIQTSYSALANGMNEVRLSGQGVGRQLLRLFWQTWNGATGASAPLAVNNTNYAQLGWRFGGNDTPESYLDGQSLRYQNERLFNSALGQYQGFGVLDWCSENAFRDSIDEGAATELRFLLEIAGGVSLSSPKVEYVQETVFAGATGA